MAVARVGGGWSGARCQFELGRLLTCTGPSINLHHPFILNALHFYATSMCELKNQNRYLKVKGTHKHICLNPSLTIGTICEAQQRASLGLIDPSGRHLTPNPTLKLPLKITRQECARNMGLLRYVRVQPIKRKTKKTNNVMADCKRQWNRTSQFTLHYMSERT